MTSIDQPQNQLPLDFDTTHTSSESDSIANPRAEIGAIARRAAERYERSHGQVDVAAEIQVPRAPSFEGRSKAALIADRNARDAEMMSQSRDSRAGRY